MGGHTLRPPFGHSQLFVVWSIQSFLLIFLAQIDTMDSLRNAMTFGPAVAKFVKRVAPPDVSPKVLQLLGQSGLRGAGAINAFSDFSDSHFRKWFGLDFPPRELEAFTSDPLVFWGYINQLRNFIRM